MLQTELIEKVRNNDRKAQMTLYNKYCDGMFYVALRYMKNSKRIVINKCLDMIKARKLETVAINEQILSVVEDDDSGWHVADHVTLDHVKAAIDELPERYKYAVQLFLVEGYDHEEVSEILNITPVASRTLVHRGKKKLQDLLKDIYDGTGY